MRQIILWGLTMYNIRIQEEILKDIKSGLSSNDISLKYGIPASIVCNLKTDISLDSSVTDVPSEEETMGAKAAVFIVSSKRTKTRKETQNFEVKNEKAVSQPEKLSKRAKKQKYEEFRDLSRKINILTKKGYLLEALENCNTPIGKSGLPILLQKVKVLVLLGKQSPLGLQENYLSEAYQICNQYCLVEEGFQVQKDNIIKLLHELNLDCLAKSLEMDSTISNSSNKQLLKK